MHRTGGTQRVARSACGWAGPTSQVGLIRHNEGRLRGQLHVVQSQLLLQADQVFYRIAPLRARGIDNEHQSPSPRHVPQELVTEPAIPVGAVDQARNVGHAQADGVLRLICACAPSARKEGHAKTSTTEGRTYHA